MEGCDTFNLILAFGDVANDRGGMPAGRCGFCYRVVLSTVLMGSLPRMSLVVRNAKEGI